MSWRYKKSFFENFVIVDCYIELFRLESIRESPRDCEVFVGEVSGSIGKVNCGMEGDLGEEIAGWNPLGYWLGYWLCTASGCGSAASAKPTCFIGEEGSRLLFS